MDFKKLTSKELRAHKGVSFVGITTSFMCHDGKGNIFFAKRSKNARDEHGRWDTGGGGLKHGESVDDCLVREIKEEYGVEPKDIEFIGYFDAFRETPDGMPTHWLAMVFAILVDPTKVKIMEPDMFDDSGWFTMDNLPSPLHSQHKVCSDKYGDKLRKAIGSIDTDAKH